MISTTNQITNKSSQTRANRHIYGWLCTGCEEVFTLERDLAVHLKANRGTCNLKQKINSKTVTKQTDAFRYRCLNFHCGVTWVGNVTAHYQEFNFLEDVIPPLVQESFKNEHKISATYYCPLCTRMWVLNDDVKERHVLSVTYPKHQREVHGKKTLSCCG